MNNFHYQNTIPSECIFGENTREDVDLTIVVPTYQRTDLLEKTLNSIKKQKQVNKLKYQVIIVSNDPFFCKERISIPLEEDIFSIYRNKENLGMVGNMNRCALLAQGKYISYIQDDDILLEDYLIEIEKLKENGILDNIDCLIPNRYYFYNNVKKGVYGKSAYKKEYKKKILKRLLGIGIKKRVLQKIDANDCGDTWYNCFSGGPTCGIVFKRKSLLDTNGFDYKFSYAFDYVFFVDYAQDHTVMLYDKYLSIYRMEDSASNKPEVQKDFFNSDMYLLDKLMYKNPFVTKYADEIVRFSYQNKSKETQELIGETIKKKKCNMIKYYYFRTIRLLRLYRRNLYRREIVPNKYKEKL